MRFLARTQTYLPSIFALTAFLYLGWFMSGCRADSWEQWTFPEAGIRFELPSSWSVRKLRPGKEAQPLSKQPAAREASPESSVVTALPVLEDAALVIVATQKTIPLDPFAKAMARFIPLEDVQFELEDLKISNKNHKGVVGRYAKGTGRLKTNRAPVFFESYVLDIQGKPTLITLYAEESKRAYYEPVFGKIRDSIQPLESVSIKINSTPAPASAPQSPPKTTKPTTPSLQTPSPATAPQPSVPPTETPPPAETPPVKTPPETPTEENTLPKIPAETSPSEVPSGKIPPAEAPEAKAATPSAQEKTRPNPTNSAPKKPKEETNSKAPTPQTPPSNPDRTKPAPKKAKAPPKTPAPTPAKEKSPTTPRGSF